MSKSKGIQPPPYTQVPNLLFDDHLPDMGLTELKVTLVAIRQILGYHKKHPETISINQFVAMTGLSRQGVVDGIAAAMERGILIQAGTGARKTAKYKLNFIDDQSTSLASDQSTQWASQDAANKLDQSTHLASSGQASRPELAYSVDTQKKVVKENSKEKELTSIPKEGIEVAPPIPEPATPEPQAQPEPVPVVQPEVPFDGGDHPDIEGAPESKPVTMAEAADIGYDTSAPIPEQVQLFKDSLEDVAEVVKEKKPRARSENQQRLDAMVEALKAAFNYVKATTSDYSYLRGVAKQLVDVDFPPGEVQGLVNYVRAMAQREQWTGRVSPTSIVTKGRVSDYLNACAKRKAQAVYQDRPIPDSWRPTVNDGVIPFPAKRNPTGTEGKF